MRILTVLILLTCAATAQAQLPNEDYRGVASTGVSLRKLATIKRVLVIGAHPDDEDNQLLSWLSLRDGADVAYLSLTRGEGGQNTIGPELGAALGVLRTGELLAARNLDLGEQFFARAYDFGFSKTAEESFQHWPRDSVLADVVAIVRRYRPDVIVAIFTGTPRDGHGQHQVSGILARAAFVAAADPNRFPEQIRAGLRAHRTFKLFQATGYRQADPSEQFATGEMDPLFGRSYAQIAAASRSRHRSQDMGQMLPLGPRSTSVRLLQSNVPIRDSTLFSGLDTTMSMRAAAAHETSAVAGPLLRYDSLVGAAAQRLSPLRAAGVGALMNEAVRVLSAVIPGIRDADLRFAAQNELAFANRALLQTSAIVIDAVSDAEALVTGMIFYVEVSVWNGGTQPTRIARVTPLLPDGWGSERIDSAAESVLPGQVVTRKFRITVPNQVVFSQPYFLARPRPGDYYSWPSASDYAGLPFQPDPVRAAVALDLNGTAVTQDVIATRRVVDPRQGELRRALHVIPAFVLRPDPATAIVTMATLTSGAKRSVNVGVEIVSNGNGGSVIVKPQLPAGWRATPGQQTLRFAGAGATHTAHFALEPARSVTEGGYNIHFTATDTTGRIYDLTQRAVDYAHVTNRVLYDPAVLHVSVLDAKFARGLRIGYIVGVDPAIPQVLEQLGISVDRLDENALANADFTKYDAIVIGSRAFEVRRDLIAHNSRILDYGRQGGNILTLYQQYEFIRDGYAPYALTLARPHDRITDENARVRLLDTTAVALTRPNRIADRDFVGWMQERALYMPHTWAPEFTPLLEMSDPGEAPRQGAIVTAPLGRGHYTYTGIAFFREIPAGVPGALRLFINLLSLGVKDVAF